jgi:hypothetical protein
VGDRTRNPDGGFLYADVLDGTFVWHRAHELSEVASMHFHVGPAWERHLQRR